MTQVRAIDLFAGAGGSSQGITAAGADVIAAANHSPEALAVHAANFPDTEHFVADLVDMDATRYIHPAELPAASFLWASPSCRFHSPANSNKLYAGAQPSLFDTAEDLAADHHANSERSRVTMHTPLLYAERHRPQIVVVENVVEVTKWGPDKNGSQFKDWLARWDALGYDVHPCWFNSVVFGCPQSRDRVYFVFWLKGNEKPNLDYRPQSWCTSDACNGREVRGIQTWKKRTGAWEMETWGKLNQQYYYRCEECGAKVQPAMVPAAAAIDWSDLGPTVGERDKPLADRTIDRIKRGIEKFADWPMAVLSEGKLVSMVIPNRIGGRAYNPLDEQVPTVVAGANHMNLASVVLPVTGNTYERPGQTRGRHTTQPLFSLTGTHEHGIAAHPCVVEMRGGGSIKSGQHSVSQPMHTVTAGGFHHGLVTAGFAKFNGQPTDTAWHGTEDLFGSVTTNYSNTGLLSTHMPLTHANSIDRARHWLEPLATLTAARERYMSTVEAPSDEVVNVEDVRFRMLKPDPELRMAMGFDEDYIMDGTKTQKVQWLGNAVTPPVAGWIAEQSLATLDDPHSGRRREAQAA